MIREELQRLDAVEAELAAASGTQREALAREHEALLARFRALSPEDVVYLARHAHRPRIDDWIALLTTDFFELRGDRCGGEDPAILGGVALFHGEPVTVLGTRKGHSLDENMAYHFGMPEPEGYRKALRLMRQAEKFARPVLAFIDTPGAYPGREAEERGQGEAIAQNLAQMSLLGVPVVAVITGEGSVVDEIVPEPLGGAQRDPAAVARALDAAIVHQLEALRGLSREELLAQRYARYRAF